MATLSFGVNDVGYSDAHGPSKRATTTGQVAEILEKRYHVMETFYHLRTPKIAEALADSMGMMLDDLVHRRSGPNHLVDAERIMEGAFRSFLDANEMQKLAMALGAPISAAALRGVNFRKKHPYAKKNPERPAFIATGLYRRSFLAEVKL